LLQFILVDAGHEYVEAVNGMQACGNYKNTDDIDLILMDVNTPKMDYVSATKIIKNMTKNVLSQ
jgi:CheY-like chemotaxis protein